jgi:AcrR family transcriptional regulator
MPVQKTDRDAIVQVALACFKRNGFHHTSMAAIAEEAGLLKGSLYHYFNDKDALALAAVEWVHTHFREHVFSHARRDDRTPAQRWRAMWEATGAYFEKSDGGCLMGNLTLEAGLTHTRLRNRCADYFDEWQDALAAVLVHRQTPAAARREAARLVAEVQGLLLLERLEKKPLLAGRVAELAGGF